MRSKAALALATLFAAFAVLPLSAQNLRGAPLLQRFTPDDYGAQPHQLDVATDGDGRLYVANVEGVLRFEGDEWQRIALPGNTVARAVTLGADGRVYVASIDSFGVLEPGAPGEVLYRDLRDAFGLKGAARHVGTVWQALAAPGGVYFRADRELFFYRYAGAEHQHWPLPEGARAFYLDGETLLMRVDGRGYGRFEDGEFHLEPGGATFADQALPGVVARAGWRLLVGNAGFFRADADGIRALNGDAARLFRETRPYAVQPLADDSVVIGTLDGVLLRFDRDLRLVDRVDLGSYAIEALTVDREGGLWAATEGDLVRLRLPSPWSYYGADQGLIGTLSDYEWHDGALWLAGSRGVGRLHRRDDGRLQADWFDWTDYEAFSLVATEAGLLLGHRTGLALLPEGAERPQPLLERDESIYQLLASAQEPGLIYALGNESLLLLRGEARGWRIVARLPLQGANVAWLHESAPGELWLSDSRGGPQRWRLDPKLGVLLERRVWGKSDGLELDPDAGSSVYLLDGKVHVVSGQRGFELHGERFVEEVAPPFSLVERPMELDVIDTPFGSYAFTSRKLLRRAPGKPDWEAVQFGAPQTRGFSNVKLTDDGVLRVATWSGLLQFDPSQDALPAPPLQARLARALLRAPEGDTMPLPSTSPGEPVEIAPGHGLILRYGLVTMEPGVEFRYRLYGLGAAVRSLWSDWTGDRDLIMRSLKPGDYALELEARTRSGRVVTPMTYRFRVLPLWYQAWWVQALAVLAGLALLALLTLWLVRLRTERYLADNRRLEARIAERTHELEELNRRLSELATEDSLTGVANRRALEQGLNREWFRHLDQRRPIGVVMIDVDHFKRYNDAHGHLEGDALLREIARHLVVFHDPQRELLARYGGEEFVLVLPGAHLEDAMRRAEAIREQFASGYPITLSLGVAAMVPTVQGEPHMLLRRADTALYEAKRNGRNRVELAVE